MPARVPMTERQREALLALPDTEDAVVRHHSLNAADLTAIAAARTPETRLSYALQLCCLRYPGRNLRRGELLPAVMLDYIAEQISVDAGVIAGFARRGPTRYEQLAAIKTHHGFQDLTQPGRAEIKVWLRAEAIGLTDGRLLLDRLIARFRAEKIIIPGVTVIERMAAEAMHAADLDVIGQVRARLTAAQRESLDAILSEKTHARQSRLAWLREPVAKVGGRSLLAILDKLDLIRATGAPELQLPEVLQPRLGQMAREGVRSTAQAFQQMGPARRHAALVATLRELEVTLTDAALDMFRALVARANLRARKRLEEAIAASADGGRERLLRIADVLDALTKAARSGRDVTEAVTTVAALEVIEADAALIRRMTRPGRPDALGELGPEYKVFKRSGPVPGEFHVRRTRVDGPASRGLRSAPRSGRGSAETAACELALGPHRAPLAPARRPARRRRSHLLGARHLFRPLGRARGRRRLGSDLASPPLARRPARAGPDRRACSRAGAPPERRAEAWIATASEQLDEALLGLSRGLSGKDARLFAGDKLRFPKEPSTDLTSDGAKQLALRSYALLPSTRITDVLSRGQPLDGVRRPFRTRVVRLAAG